MPRTLQVMAEKKQHLSVARSAPRTVGQQPNEASLALQESLRQLHGVRSSIDTYAEQAVNLLARASRAEAAALLACDARASRARLLAAAGAAPEVLQVLCTQQALWIPLRCLNEKRINVIASAHHNPFVPQHLVSALSKRGLTIATVPFFHGDVPVGAVVLFSSNPATFSDTVLYSVSQALRICAPVVAGVYGSAAPAEKRPPTLPRGPVQREQEAAPPAASPETSQAKRLLEAERRRAERLEKELANLRAAGEQLPMLQEEVSRLNQQANDARRAAEEARARAASMEAARAEAEQQARAAAETLEAFMASREQQQREVEEALELARRRSEEVAQFDERMHELEARAERAEELEKRAQELEGRIESLQNERRQLREQLAAAQEERDRARGELAGAQTELESALIELSARDEAARTLQDAASEGSSRVAELEQEIERLRRSHQESAALQERLGKVESERDGLREKLQRAEASAGESARVQGRVAELEAALEEARQQAEQVRVAAGLDPLQMEPEIVDALRQELSGDLNECQKLVAQLKQVPKLEAKRSELARRFTTIRGAVAAVGLEAIVHQLSAGERFLEDVERGTHPVDARTMAFLERLLESVRGLVARALDDREQTFRIMGDVDAEIERWREAAAEPAAAAGGGRASGTARSAVANLVVPGGASNMIRVDASRLDAIIEKIGELEQARGRNDERLQALTRLRDRIKGKAATQDLEGIIEAFSSENEQLDSLGRDLQIEVESLRSMPIDGVLRRLQRPVRDAARQSKKHAELVIENGDLRLDRTITEALYGPLLHIVRNAVAHGIESAEVRKARGKSECGTVRIRARIYREEGGNGSAAMRAQIRVEDDGGGISVDSIRSKARERGLIAEDANPSRDELLRLIFEPGFSTAPAVNDLAGRGVGMDVVAKEIGQLGGMVNVDSEEGVGTTIELDLPVRSAVR